MLNPQDPADDDLATFPSAHCPAETVERLKAILSKKQIPVLADIDHAAAAEKVGLALRPTRVIIFGNARAGTPLIASHQAIGLDLPLRALIWEDADGKVWLAYHRPEFLAQRHKILDQDEAVKTLGAGLAAIVQAAVSA